MFTPTDNLPQEDPQVETRDLIPFARAPCWEHRMDNIRREALALPRRYEEREAAYLTEDRVD